MAEAQIGVLIDYENVGLSPILSLFDQLSDLGRIIIKRAYADWSKAGDKADQMLELGIEAKHYFRISGSGKNASDICLAIDAIELLYDSPLDTFVIVSSDSDFLPLVSVLRSSGKTVIGAGRRGVVAPSLIRSCDRYIYLDDGAPQAPAQTALDDPESLLRRAVEASMDDHGEVVAGKLHNTMRRMDPAFDFRAMGHRTFTQFLNSSPSVKTRRPRGGTDIWVELTSNQNHRAEQARTPQQAEQTKTPQQAEQTRTPQPAEQTRTPQPAEQTRTPQPAEQTRTPQPAEQTRTPQPEEAPRRDEGQSPDEGWESRLHETWARVPGGFLSGSKAAADASKVLEISKISSSRFKNLQGLLDASDFLRSRWRRDGNSIRRISAP